MSIRFVPLNSSEFMTIDSNECVMHAGALTREQLGIFFLLIQKRRPLPQFHGQYWRCHLCSFKCDSLETMATHLFDDHDEEPYNDAEEFEEYQDPYLEELLSSQ